MSIKDWPVEERPREKLLAKGTVSLSDAELLAIFIRTGMKGQSAVSIARDLLKKMGGLRKLMDANCEQFCQFPGLGITKYTQLQAALEISKRHLLDSLKKDDLLDNPEQTKRYIQSHLSHSDQEVFGCLFLDNKNRIIKFEKLFFGTINTASVHPRIIAKKALEYHASKIIACHNHPSGEVKPSLSDDRMTETLKQALAILDICLIDHIIVGGNQAYSYVEHGW